MKYEVQLRRRVYEYKIVEVEADTPETARKAALAQNRETPDEDWCDASKAKRVKITKVWQR